MNKNKHKVGKVAELPENGDRLIAEINGQEIAVFRIDDEFYALANYCVHQGGPLCEGEMSKKTEVPDGEWMWESEEEEKVIKCPWHAWRFDVSTGVSLDNSKYKTPTYKVTLDGSDIYVSR